MTSDDGSRDDSKAAPAGDDAPQEGKLRPRYAVNFDLTLNSDSYFYAGSATNLSDGGFFVATHYWYVYLRPEARALDMIAELNPATNKNELVRILTWPRSRELSE